MVFSISSFVAFLDKLNSAFISGLLCSVSNKLLISSDSVVSVFPVM